QWTLEELHSAPNFRYVAGRFVHAFEEDGTGVRVRATRLDTGEEESHAARALVVAAGTLGATWLVLHSGGRYDTPVPLLCNPYAYVPTRDLGMPGREWWARRYSLRRTTA